MASVDTHVGEHIFSEVIGKNGLLQKKVCEDRVVVELLMIDRLVVGYLLLLIITCNIYNVSYNNCY